MILPYIYVEVIWGWVDTETWREYAGNMPRKEGVGETVVGVMDLGRPGGPKPTEVKFVRGGIKILGADGKWYKIKPIDEQAKEIIGDAMGRLEASHLPG